MSIKISLLAAGILAASVYASTACAGDDRKVVHDTQDNIILNTFGNCVRTKWNAYADACAPRTAERKPPRKMRKARELAREERTVYFDFDHYNIRPDQQHKLDNLADVLKSDKEVKSVHIVGYADRIGSASYNRALSEYRARNIENYLHKREYLNTALARVRWLGKSESVNHCREEKKRNALIACLQKDRRVEVEIDYYPKNK
jgi:outer membrane protein OmpA-like peptidoglycan-associated protein